VVPLLGDGNGNILFGEFEFKISGTVLLNGDYKRVGSNQHRVKCLFECRKHQISVPS